MLICWLPWLYVSGRTQKKLLNRSTRSDSMRKSNSLIHLNCCMLSEFVSIARMIWLPSWCCLMMNLFRSVKNCFRWSESWMPHHCSPLYCWCHVIVWVLFVGYLHVWYAVITTRDLVLSSQISCHAHWPSLLVSACVIYSVLYWVEAESSVWCLLIGVCFMLCGLLCSGTLWFLCFGSLVSTWVQYIVVLLSFCSFANFVVFQLFLGLSSVNSGNSPLLPQVFLVLLFSVHFCCWRWWFECVLVLVVGVGVWGRVEKCICFDVFWVIAVVVVV